MPRQPSHPQPQRRAAYARSGCLGGSTANGLCRWTRPAVGKSNGLDRTVRADQQDVLQDVPSPQVHQRAGPSSNTEVTDRHLQRPRLCRDRWQRPRLQRHGARRARERVATERAVNVTGKLIEWMKTGRLHVWQERLGTSGAARHPPRTRPAETTIRGAKLWLLASRGPGRNAARRLRGEAADGLRAGLAVTHVRTQQGDRDAEQRQASKDERCAALVARIAAPKYSAQL
jgi:hypothetical protein